MMLLWLVRAIVWGGAFALGVSLIISPRLIDRGSQLRNPLYTRRVLMRLGLGFVALASFCSIPLTWLLVTDSDLGIPAGDLFTEAVVSYGILGLLVAFGMLQYSLAATLGSTLSEAQEIIRQRNLPFMTLSGWFLVVSPLLPFIFLFADGLGFIATVVGFMAAIIRSIPMIVYMGFGVVFIFAAIAISISNRRARQATLLWLLAIAVKKGLPLDTEVEYLAMSYRGKTRRRLNRLAKRLQQGRNLASALDEFPGLIPRFAVATVFVGEKTGTLSEALREAAISYTQGRRTWTPGVTSGAKFALHLAALGLVAMNVLGFLMYWIIPKFKKIFEGFNMELPQISVWLIFVCDCIVNYFYLVSPLILIAMMFLGRLAGVPSLQWIRLPAFLQRLTVPWILRTLAVIVAARRPVLDGIDVLAREHEQAAIRKRLQKTSRAVAAGVECWDSFAAAGLLRSSDAAVLKSAERAGNLAWALRELAESKERGFNYRFAVWLEIIEPLLLVIAGLVVLFICVGFFMPLVKMIHDLS